MYTRLDLERIRHDGWKAGAADILLGVRSDLCLGKQSSEYAEAYTKGYVQGQRDTQDERLGIAHATNHCPI